MKIGLVGLPKSGKTTIFNALTKSHAEVALYSSAKAEPNLATINVGDERIDKLTGIYQPKKTIYATLDISDFAGMQKETESSEAMPAAVMQLVRNSHALAVILRNFENELGEAPDPVVELGKIKDEFILSDLIIVEKRQNAMAKTKKAGLKTPALELEDKLMTRISKKLNNMESLIGMELSPDEAKAIRGYQFLTLKPIMVILNSGEDNYGKNQQTIDTIAKQHPIIEYAGNFEMEISRMEDEEEVKAFMEDMGITQSARTVLTSTAYKLMGYISFFTVGPDEVRAWNIQKGDTAIEAAGTIHSDLARGFIRAECFSYDDFMAAGSEKGVKEAGKFRLEGKEYQVADGDILNIRFNV